MNDQFERTRMLMGDEAINKLQQSRVAVFGVGGVGGYVVEVLARSGVGAIDLIDNDTVSVSNINRQIIALHSTIGRRKVDVAEERILDINPDCRVRKYAAFYLSESSAAKHGIELPELNFKDFDYVVDCIDTVTGKIEIARQCHEANVPVLSCMGAANKMDPTGFRVTDLFRTNIDPLAKMMRKKLRKMGIDNLKVVFSEETPQRTVLGISSPVSNTSAEGANGNVPHPVPASNAFVPAAAGLIAGGEVVKDLIGWNGATQ